MHQLLYYIIIIPLSLLPHFVLYKISDLLCVVMKDILKYRKDIILGNIKRSFPEKTVINSWKYMQTFTVIFVIY